MTRCQVAQGNQNKMAKLPRTSLNLLSFPPCRDVCHTIWLPLTTQNGVGWPDKIMRNSSILFVVVVCLLLLLLLSSSSLMLIYFPLCVCLPLFTLVSQIVLNRFRLMLCILVCLLFVFLFSSWRSSICTTTVCCLARHASRAPTSPG